MKKALFIFVLIATKVVAQIPTNGLIGYYPLDGNANDLSGNANNGVIMGALLDTGHTGISNTCYNFSTGHINLNSQITLPDSNLTLTCWVKMTYEETLDTNLIVSYSKNVNYQDGDFEFYIQNSHYNDDPWPGSWDFFPNCRVETKNDGFHTGSYAYYSNWNFRIEANRWYFVVVEITPDSISYSIDNQYFENDLTYSKLMGGIQYESGVIGKNFNGNIDEIRLYDRKLTSQELNVIKSKIATNTLDHNVHLEISLFPNPSKQHSLVNIKNLPDVAHIIVYDSYARIVYRSHAHRSQLQISTAGWAKGTYFLQVVDANNVVTTEKLQIL